MKQNKLIKILTHDGKFHSDDVTGVALLKVFGNKINDITGEANIWIRRVPHDVDEDMVKRMTNTTLNEYDYVIDIYRQFDGVKYFDHHQNNDPVSSAGLIWEMIQTKLNIKGHYESIDRLVKGVDLHDTGRVRSREFELPNLIENMNATGNDIESSDAMFLQAVEFVSKIILDCYITDIKLLHQFKEIYKAETLAYASSVKILDFKPDDDISGEMFDDIEAFIYKSGDRWVIKTIPEKKGSFEPNGRNMSTPSEIELDFKHKGLFYAADESLDKIFSFAKEQFGTACDSLTKYKYKPLSVFYMKMVEDEMKMGATIRQAHIYAVKNAWKVKQELLGRNVK